jgi:CO dehydrogenase nickel-insertion accessory protein CooC1
VNIGAEEEFIRRNTAGLEFLGFIPFDPGLAGMQIQGIPVINSPVIETAVGKIYQRLLATTAGNPLAEGNEKR